MGAPSLVSYSFPTDGYRLGNICDRPGCRADAVLRETSTDAIYCSELCAHAYHPPLTPTYAALATEAIRIGAPSRWRRDLTLWDRMICADLQPGEAMLWIVRDCGTHVVRETNNHREVMARAVLGTYGDVVGCYHVDHARLTKITPERAIEYARAWDRAKAGADRKVA